MNVIQTIEVDAQKVLGVIDTILPFVEKYIPAVAAVGGPIGLGLSAASALLPLIQLIPVGTVWSAEVQQSYKDRVQALALLDFTGPQWQVSTKPPTA